MFKIRKKKALIKQHEREERRKKIKTDSKSSVIMKEALKENKWEFLELAVDLIEALIEIF